MLEGGHACRCRQFRCYQPTPVADVSRSAADPDNAPPWYENIESVEWKTPRPVQVGSHIDFVAQFLGRRLAYTYEVVEFVDGRLTMRTPGPPFPMETQRTTLGGRQRRHANDTPEPRRSEGLRSSARASDVSYGRKGEQEGPGVTEATS